MSGCVGRSFGNAHRDALAQLRRWVGDVARSPPRGVSWMTGMEIYTLCLGKLRSQLRLHFLRLFLFPQKEENGRKRNNGG